MRQLALRCAFALVVMLVVTPGASAQAPATVFSAAGSAIGLSDDFGPCAVAVAGADSDGDTVGRGTFTATGVTTAPNQTSCDGPAASLRYDVISISQGTPASATAYRLTVSVTQSDDLTTPPGTIGHIDIDETAPADANFPAGNRITVVIGTHGAAFPGVFGNTVYGGFLDLRADVEIDARPSVTNVNFFAGTGTARDESTGSFGLVTSAQP